ncbi:hypothetical protein IWQ60_004464 [Tieghemiomyces parasiticus]|uniref:Major facilitator superfamily (MFS) profile domain-containing protein n=1 Tax=Tieghemiomyces parasiticus TaxID=78921 RepID=A0A9W8AFU5_9FUNG|nr:hypothetical protein IWQ60_004464 [Tieghemiomyces parasiticus]
MVPPHAAQTAPLGTAVIAQEAERSVEMSNSKLAVPPVASNSTLNHLPSIGPPSDLPYSPFSPAWKRIIVALSGVAGILATFATTVLLPAIPSIAQDLESTVSRINLTVSVFLIGQGVAPILWGPLADQFGRRYAYSFGCLVCTLASAGCALARTDSLLLGMRFLQAFGSSATLVTTAGTISDLYEPAQRGRALGLCYSTQMFGPVLGTIFGGLITTGWGWRWTMWVTTILSASFFIALTLFLPETHRATVARQRRLALKDLPPDLHLRPRPTISLAQTNPFALFSALRLKYVSVPVICTTLLFNSFFAANTVMTTVLSNDYDYSASVIGLCYIPFGVGCIVGAFVGGIVADRAFQRQILRIDRSSINGDLTGEQSSPCVVNGDEKPLPTNNPPYEARLRSAPGLLITFSLALIAWAWTLNFALPVAASLACAFLIGLCLNVCNNALLTYLVDIFTAKSASISSVANTARCFYCALWISFINVVVAHWGVGWAFTFLAAHTLLGAILVVLLYRHGATWRLKTPPTPYLSWN